MPQSSSTKPEIEPALRAADPTHPAYINLNNADDPVAFIETVRPDLLSIDRYQWWYGREDYIPLLERYRQFHPGIPVLKMSYDGLTHVGEDTRIEAFVYQAAQHARVASGADTRAHA